MLRRSELAKSGDMIVDVLLQSAGEGVSQDANQILTEFPHSMKDLAQYDTILAFDPDWRELDPQQIELVEKWVGEESGGLIGIAGPVFTDAWVQAPAIRSSRGHWNLLARAWKPSFCGSTTARQLAMKCGIRSKACLDITGCEDRSRAPRPMPIIPIPRQ
jgi:hypothetical protein